MRGGKKLSVPLLEPTATHSTRALWTAVREGRNGRVNGRGTRRETGPAAAVATEAAVATDSGGEGLVVEGAVTTTPGDNNNVAMGKEAEDRGDTNTTRGSISQAAAAAAAVEGLRRGATR